MEKRVKFINEKNALIAIYNPELIKTNLDINFYDYLKIVKKIGKNKVTKITLGKSLKNIYHKFYLQENDNGEDFTLYDNFLTLIGKK